MTEHALDTRVSTALALAAPTRTVLALVPVIAAITALVIYCLADVLRARTVRFLPKPVWAVIVLMSVPLGALAYLLFGKDGRGPADTNTGVGDGDDWSDAVTGDRRG